MTCAEVESPSLCVELQGQHRHSSDALKHGLRDVAATALKRERETVVPPGKVIHGTRWLRTGRRKLAGDPERCEVVLSRHHAGKVSALRVRRP